MAKAKIKHLADVVTLVEENLNAGLGVDIAAFSALQDLMEKLSSELGDLLYKMLLGIDGELQLVMVESLLDFYNNHVVHTTGCLTMDTILKLCYKWIAEEQGYESGDIDETLMEEQILTADDFVRNKHGIRVRKGCFSCRFQKFCDSEETRLCKMDNQEHPRCHLCAHWKMRPSLQKAGNSGGKVKRREYLDYITAIRALGSDEEPRDTKSIRAEFESKFGGIFAIM